MFFGPNGGNNIGLLETVTGNEIGCQDANRRYSERTSDRRLERGDTREDENDNAEPNDEQQSELTDESGFNNPISPNNQMLERKMPTLSIITEEDT